MAQESVVVIFCEVVTDSPTVLSDCCDGSYFLAASRNDGSTTATFDGLSPESHAIVDVISAGVAT